MMNSHATMDASMPQISINIRPWVHRPSLLWGSALILGTVSAAIAIAPAKVREPSVPLLVEFAFQWFVVPPILYFAGMARRSAAPFQWTPALVLFAMNLPRQFAARLVILPPDVMFAVTIAGLVASLVIMVLGIWGLVLFRRRENQTARERLAHRRVELYEGVGDGSL